MNPQHLFDIIGEQPLTAQGILDEFHTTMPGRQVDSRKTAWKSIMRGVQPITLRDWVSPSAIQITPQTIVTEFQFSTKETTLALTRSEEADKIRALLNALTDDAPSYEDTVDRIISQHHVCIHLFPLCPTC